MRVVVDGGVGLLEYGCHADDCLRNLSKYLGMIRGQERARGRLTPAGISQSL